MRRSKGGTGAGPCPLLPTVPEGSSASCWPTVYLTPLSFSFLFYKTRKPSKPLSLELISPLSTSHMDLILTCIVAPILPPFHCLRLRDRLQCPPVGQCQSRLEDSWAFSVPPFTTLYDNSVHLSSPYTWHEPLKAETMSCEPLHPQCLQHNVVQLINILRELNNWELQPCAYDSRVIFRESNAFILISLFFVFCFPSHLATSLE